MPSSACAAGVERHGAARLPAFLALAGAACTCSLLPSGGAAWIAGGQRGHTRPASAQPLEASSAPRPVPSAAWDGPPLAPLTGLGAAAVLAARARRRQNRDHTLKASTLEETGEAEAGSLKAFWKFLRPHTIRGTILGSSAMVARVVLESGKPPDWNLLPIAMCGVLSLLCGNGFIVGINQIYDVSIDVINKPFLPIAAKELSISQAWVLITVMAVLGTGIAFRFFGPLIGSLYVFGLFLGTIYSIPATRLKQSAVAAALIIATVRGFLLNFGVYYATRAMLKVPFSWSYPTIMMTCFCTIYAIVIAVTKDLPDMKGDLENDIDTFATRYGPGKVSLAAASVLFLNYAGAVVWTLGPTHAAFRPWVILPVHAVLASLLVRGWLRLRQADFGEEALKAFYRLIWSLFYTEYFLFPLV